MKLNAINSRPVTLNESIISSLLLSGLVRIRSWATGLPPEVKNSPAINDLINQAGNMGNESLAAADAWWNSLGTVFQLSADELQQVRTEATNIGTDWSDYTLRLYGHGPRVRNRAIEIDDNLDTRGNDEGGRLRVSPRAGMQHVQGINDLLGKAQDILTKYDEVMTKHGPAESLMSSKHLLVDDTGPLGNIKRIIGGSVKNLARVALDLANPIRSHRQGRELLVKSNNRLMATLAVKLAVDLSLRKQRQVVG